MDPATIAAGITALFSLFGGGGNNSSNALTPEQQQLLTRLLGLQVGRAESSDPVHQAAMAMALRLAPTYARGAMPPRAPMSGGGGPSFSAPGDAVSRMAGLGPYRAGNPGASLSPSGVVYLNGQAYANPSAGANPNARGSMVGPEDPDPYHHPTGTDVGRQVSDAMQAFFFGNPYGAFYGGGVAPGSGDQSSIGPHKAR
jgi:hypothetical protein